MAGIVATRKSFKSMIPQSFERAHCLWQGVNFWRWFVINDYFGRQFKRKTSVSYKRYKRNKTYKNIRIYLYRAYIRNRKSG